MVKRESHHRQLIVNCVLLLIVGFFAVDSVARAQHWPEVGAGELLLETESGVVPASVLETQMRIVIRGPVARIVLTQRYTNQTEEWMEAIYAYPLPDQAAVDRLQLKIGERLIAGEIHERQQAKRIYTRARDQGKRALLVEQHRPNLFTTRLANIAPNETIEVVLAYVQPLVWQRGSFSLRVPMTYTPRYRPKTKAEYPGQLNAGNSLPTAAFAGGPEITLDIWLDAGLPLNALESRYHRISVQRDNGWRHIRLADGVAVANRDFVLSWTPEIGRYPETIAFAEQQNGETYALLMLMPSVEKHIEIIPREIVFVVDTSGSMHGESIKQAKAALVTALKQLQPHDRFNIIRFDSDAEQLFRRPVAADSLNINGAIEWIAGFRAEGGTEIASALKLALAHEGQPEYLRQIVFLTDGAVGNELQLFQLIHQKLGDARLFTIGIGAAPNTWFMRKAAQFGRGGYTYIAKTAEVQKRMKDLFQRLSRPVLKDLCVNWPVAAESFPQPLPDLYAGEPLVVYAKLSTLDGRVAVCGKKDGFNWQDSAKLANSQRQAGIGKLWARKKIESLMDSRITGADSETLRASVIKTAINHHLVSAYTSLVAVDKTPARTLAALKQRRIAGAAPAGWTHAASLPQTATPVPVHAWLGLAGLLLAALAWWLGRNTGLSEQ